MNQWIKNGVLLSLTVVAIGCGGTPEVAPVTAPGENASDAEMKARMEESMKKSGRPDAPK